MGERTLDRRLLRKLQRQRLSRREFLQRAGGAAGLSLFCLWAGPALGADAGSERFRFTPAQRRLFGAVQERLLPSAGEGPGAREVHATAYLEQAMGYRQFDPEIRAFLLRGARWLEETAQEVHGHGFLELSPPRQVALLRRVAGEQWGENWLSTLLDYSFEALLCDPVYGGNPEAIAWRWLEHQPGFPRPPAAKRYFSL